METKEINGDGKIHNLQENINRIKLENILG